MRALMSIKIVIEKRIGRSLESGVSKTRDGCIPSAALLLPYITELCIVYLSIIAR